MAVAAIVISVRSCQQSGSLPAPPPLLSGGFFLLLLFGALHFTGISAALLVAYWTAKTVAHALGL
jgi:hypothetical protein